MRGANKTLMNLVKRKPYSAGREAARPKKHETLSWPPAEIACVSAAQRGKRQYTQSGTGMFGCCIGICWIGWGVDIISGVVREHTCHGGPNN